VRGETHTHDRTLVTAVNKAIDRVEYHLGVDDALMADVSGAIVRKLLSHPSAAVYSFDFEWRRMLARWEHLRTRLTAPPLMLADLVEHHASVLLIEATRAAERAAAQ
jgi:hypothetical protein